MPMNINSCAGHLFVLSDCMKTVVIRIVSLLTGKSVTYLCGLVLSVHVQDAMNFE